MKKPLTALQLLQMIWSLECWTYILQR